MHRYSPDLNPLPLYAPVRFHHNPPPLPYLSAYFIDGPFAAKQINIQCYNNNFEL